MAPRLKTGEWGRQALAKFLHHYPQYQLSDLRDGTLSVAEFRLLFAGMIDELHPEMTEPLLDIVNRKVRTAHAARSGKKGGW